MAKHFTSYLLLVLVLFSASIGACAGLHSSEAEADLVRNLPGQPPVGFNHFAGYVNVHTPEQKGLFYWFFEAEEDAANKPLVLWLHGGPGCSSVALGALQELGPFLIQTDEAKLTLNDFSWNKVANMLFLESPVGVGFSYTNDSTVFAKIGDKLSATDSYAFLVGWFGRFPSYKSHPFYITGESYAGHFAPQLADLIQERNKVVSEDTHINLKGLMVGNAVMNTPTDATGIVEYAWTHAIISDKLHGSILKNCGDFNWHNITSRCFQQMMRFNTALAGIDEFSIYSPNCIPPGADQKLATAPHLLSQHDGVWHTMGSASYNPCGGDFAGIYLNRREVQKALHANITNLPYPYMICTLGLPWNDAPRSVLPVMSKLLDAGLRIWVYSGDSDARVPVTSTRLSINKMGLEMVEEWRPWSHNHRLAGWVETYDGGLTLATIRGAGHQVPLFAPAQALSLFTHFLSAKTLPSYR